MRLLATVPTLGLHSTTLRSKATFSPVETITTDFILTAANVLMAIVRGTKSSSEAKIGKVERMEELARVLRWSPDAEGEHTFFFGVSYLSTLPGLINLLPESTRRTVGRSSCGVEVLSWMQIFLSSIAVEWTLTRECM
jgi:hypothetical protein